MKKLTILLFSMLIMAPFMANAISLSSLNSEIQDKKKQLTTLQFKEYFPNLLGTKVDWSGKVLNVNKSPSIGLSNSKSKYSIRLDVSATNNSSLFGSFKVSDKATALTLDKNQEYNFSGEITLCSGWSGIDTCYIDITGFK